MDALPVADLTPRKGGKRFHGFDGLHPFLGGFNLCLQLAVARL